VAIRTRAGGALGGDVLPSPAVEEEPAAIAERLAAANERILKRKLPRTNEVRVGRFNRHLQKLLSMKGAAPASTLSKEISAHIVLEDASAADQRYLQSWETFGTAQNVAAATGFNSGGELRNPAGSNLIAVVERISFSASAAERVEFSVGAKTVSLPVLDVTVGYDGRTRQFGAGLIASHNPVGSGLTGLGVVGFSDFNATTSPPIELIFTEDQEFALLPGFAAQIRGLTVTTGIAITWKWRERYLEDSERS